MSQLHDSLLPWHAAVWPALMQQSAKGGGLLLTGPSGHGKRHLARRLSQALLCEAPQADGQPCGVCAGCLLCRSHQHPDWMEVATEQHWDDFIRLRTEGSDGTPDSGNASSASDSGGSERKAARDIRIADIRQLERLTTLSAHRGGRRVVLIWPADDMTTEASNALLKTLEEPGHCLHFILVSAHPARLLPTIRSRVRLQDCGAASPEQARAWLQAHQIEQADSALGLCTGAPIQALALAQGDSDAGDSLANRDAFVRWLLDPASATQVERPGVFDKLGLPVALHLVVLTASELLRVQQGAGCRHLVYLSTELQRHRTLNTVALHRVAKAALDFLPMASHPLNVRMQLDALLQDWFFALNNRKAA